MIDFEEYEIKPDRIFLVSPKQIHNWDYAENSKGYILTVDNSLGAELNLDFSFPYIDIDDKTEELLSVVFPDLTDNFQKNVDIRTNVVYLRNSYNLL